MKSFRIICAVVILCSLLMCCHSEPEAYYIGTEFKLSYIKSLKLFVDQINSDGGINGVPIKILQFPVKENASKAESALYAAEEMLKNEKLLAVIGPVESSRVMAYAHILKDNIAMAVPVATYPELSEMNAAMQRICSSDKLQGKFLADVAVNRFSAKRIVMLYENSIYAKYLARQFSDQVKKRGSEVVKIAWIGAPRTINADQVEKEIKDIDPDLIFFAGGTWISEFLVNQCNWDLPGKIILTGDACFKQQYAIEFSEQNKSFRWYSSSFFNPGSKNKSTREFLQSFEERFKVTPTAVEASVYDSLLLIAEVIRKGGTSRKSFVSTLRLMQQENAMLNGITGSVRMLPKGEVTRSAYVLSMDARTRLVAHAVLSDSDDLR